MHARGQSDRGQPWHIRGRFVNCIVTSIAPTAYTRWLPGPHTHAVVLPGRCRGRIPHAFTEDSSTRDMARCLLPWAVA